MYFSYYFLFFVLNEIIKTNAAVSSSKIDAAASSSKDHVELIPCPYVHFTKKLDPHNEEDEKLFNEECVKACSENKRYHGIWYKIGNGKKKAACWTTFRYGAKFNYDATTQLCECGMNLPAQASTRRCKPRMKIHGISSAELCGNECEEKKVHLYISKIRKHNLGFCYVKDVYKYPNLVGKPTLTKYYKELRCHCAVEDLPANALSAIEDRRKYAYPVNEHYSPEELSAIVDALKTGMTENLSIVLSNLSESPGNSSRPIPVSLANEIPGTSMRVSPVSSVKSFWPASLASVHPGTSLMTLPTDKSRRENHNSSSSTTLNLPTRAIITENLARQNNPQLPSASMTTSNKAIHTDRVELIACPNSYFTRKLNPYNKEEEKIFNEECEKACSENTSYHGIWYINKYRKKEAACWNTFRYGVRFHYDEAAQMCECGIHLKIQRNQPCKPRMVFRGISSSELCDDECEEKKVYAYNSKKRTYSLGFCYVKNGYIYPNLVGKPTYSLFPEGRELKCHCAVEDLTENALSSIEDKWVYVPPHNKDYSPEELRSIVEALETGMSKYLSTALSNLPAFPGNSTRAVLNISTSEIPSISVGINPANHVNTFSMISVGKLEIPSRTNYKSSPTATQGRAKRVTSSKFPENVPANTINDTTGREHPDNLIGVFSRASLGGVIRPGISTEAPSIDSSRRKNPHASSSTIFIPPINASTESSARQNHPQLYSAPPRTSTNATPHYLVKPVPRRLSEFPTFFNTTILSSSSETTFLDTPPRLSLSPFPSTVLPTTEILPGNNQTTPIQDNSENLNTTLSLGRIYAREDSSTGPSSKKPRRGSE